VPDNTPYESVTALYPSLIAAHPGSVRVYVSTAEFLDIGTPADYLHTSCLVGAREGTTARHGPRTRVHPTARVEASVLWDDVEVGEGTMLRHCIVTDGAQVPPDTSWVGVILRCADGELAPGEKRIGDLAVSSL
jgi:NDP-sugar pyrophosphorylase family protein